MSKNAFPWTVFSANTLRPMVADIMRAGERASQRLSKEASLALLRKIEEHGLDTALKDLSRPNASVSTSASTSKRKHEEQLEEDDTEPPPKRRGRPSKERVEEQQASDDETTQSPPKRRGRLPRQAASASASASAPVAAKTGSRSRPGQGTGLQTRQKAAQARGENVPARSWASAPRSRPEPTARSRSGARKAPQKAAKLRTTAAAASVSAPLSAGKPKSKTLFDGVELLKRGEPSPGKGKGREDADAELMVNGVDGEHGVSDEDAEGEVIDEAQVVETSSLENSNKENDLSLLDIANADSSTEPEIDAAEPTEEIGSPAPQINVEPTDDQIEGVRNQDRFFQIGSPAPEINIEPTADDGGAGNVEENGHTGVDGLLHPRIDTQARAGSVELNPEYTIQVFSPVGSQHGSDPGDERWGVGSVNGSPVLQPSLQAAGGGIDALD